MSRKQKRIRESKLLDLPVEILVDIFLRLPVKSHCSIQCVSKTLCRIITGPFATTLLSRLLNTDKANANASLAADHCRVRQLMRFSRVRRSDTPLACNLPKEVTALQFLKLDGDKTLTRGQHAFDLSQILNAKDKYQTSTYSVHFVFRNLICLKHRLGHQRCFLINPYVSGNVPLRIPASNLYGKGSTLHILKDWYGMGFDNITNSYKIVRLSVNANNNGNKSRSTEVLDLGTNNSWHWRHMPVGPPLPYPCTFRTSLCAYGDMHWLVPDGSKHTIISFDFTKEEFYWMPQPMLGSPRMELHLVSLRGSMAIVDTGQSKIPNIDIEIWVLKNFDKKEWVKECYIIKNDAGMRPPYGFGGNIYCTEWEHGIIFKKMESFTGCFHSGYDAYLVDLRDSSMKQVKYPLFTEELPEDAWIFYSEATRIFSLSGV